MAPGKNKVKLLKRSNVTYAFEDPFKKDGIRGFRKYTYQLEFYGEKQENVDVCGERQVWILGERPEDFHTLVNLWNREPSNFKYWW